MRHVHRLGDIYCSENGETLHFGNAEIELVFSFETGNLIGGIDKALRRKLIGASEKGLPSVLLRVGGHRKPAGVVRNSRVFDVEDVDEVGNHLTYESYSVINLDGEVALEITAWEGDWAATSIFRISPSSTTVARDVRLSYRGSDEIRLHDVRLIVPCISIGDEQGTWLEAPDYPVTTHFPLSEVSPGIWEGLDSRSLTAPGIVQHSVDAPGSVAGLVALHNPELGVSLMCWPHSTSEFSIMEVNKHAQGVDFVQWLFLADRFSKDQTLEAGRQYLRLDHGSWDEAMHRFQDWYDAVGLAIPDDRPDWVEGVAIYEVHVGRAPFLDDISYEPYPTMADLVNDLPRIAELGFEVIQLMPHWPFCGYTVHDYYEIDKQYGDESELKAMVHVAQGLGMKVILDVVLHGCVDKEIIRWDMSVLDPRYHFIFSEWLDAADERSKYRDEHPEWFMQDVSGDTARIYTWAFDHANRSFQDFIIGVLKHYIAELGVDGFRFDAPTWNCMPNWARGLPYRASAAYYASYHMLKRVREAIKEAYPEVLLYTEPSGPLFRDSMDLTYNYDEEWLSGSIIDVVSERGYAGARIYNGRRLSAKDIAGWMHYRSLSLPRGSTTVHHLDSHDTFWWGEKAQFRHEAFGVAASRALFALYALVDGGIMVYVGAEEGSEGFYRRLMHLRQSMPALRRGDCDYLAIDSDQEMVLTLLRTHAQEHAIPVINLSDTALRVRLQLPIDRLKLGQTQSCVVYDVFNQESIEPAGEKRLPAGELRRLEVYMPAFGVRVLQVHRVDGETDAG